jgi:hypothetical protein
MIRWWAAFVLALVPLLSSARAQACACCSDPGYRSERVEPFTAYQREILGKLAFDSSPELYRDASDHAVTGIDDKESADYTLSVTQAAGVFTFSFQGVKGKSGKLTFARPKNLDSFVVDPLHGPSSGNGPVLYKEWRLSSSVRGTGIFQRGLGKNARVKLVLHGKGLVCEESDMFTHWSLHVKSGATHYTFYGKLKKP